jgi:hypothetical protein
MSDTYAIYYQWCLDHHRTPPTKTWWDNAVKQPRQPTPKQNDFDFDIETERREGYAYD